MKSIAELDKEQSRVNSEQLLAFVRGIIGGVSGRPDDDNPLPPGPWGPVVRVAVERVLSVFGPSPEPWLTGRSRRSFARAAGRRFEPQGFEPQPVPWKLVLESLLERHPELFDVIGGGHRRGEEVELNPQPLPPRYAFLLAVAEVVAERAELFQEITDASSRDGSERGIIIVGGYLDRFVDDWCGNGFKPRWPFPGPPPPWFVTELTAMDLVMVAVQLGEAAKQAYTQELEKDLTRASATFAERGLGRLRES